MNITLDQGEIYFVVGAFIFIVFDVVCGTLKAFLTKTLSSKEGWKGVTHKTGFVLAIVLGVILHIAQSNIDLGIHIPILIMICSYIILVEIISILENLGEMNPELRTSKFMSFFDFALDDGSEPTGKHVKED